MRTDVVGYAVICFAILVCFVMVAVIIDVRSDKHECPPCPVCQQNEAVMKKFDELREIDERARMMNDIFTQDMNELFTQDNSLED